MVEEVLQLFIGQVDAELFKSIHCEVLKAKNVKDAWSAGDGTTGKSHLNLVWGGKVKLFFIDLLDEH